MAFAVDWIWIKTRAFEKEEKKTNFINPTQAIISNYNYRPDSPTTNIQTINLQRHFPITLIEFNLNAW